MLMKKLVRILFLFLFVGLILILGGILTLSLYYRNNFPVNTWINGVYCTGKTVEQVNGELAQQTTMPPVIIVGADGKSWQLDTKDIEGKADYTRSLKTYLRQNASMLWMNRLQKTSAKRLDPTGYSFDSGKLRESFEKLEPVRDAENMEDGVALVLTEKGYELRDGNTMRLDPERAFSYLEECLKNGETFVSLADGNCYYDLEDSQQDRKQREIFSLVEKFADCGIVYDMGAEKIPLTADITGQFLTVGEDGLPVLDPSGNLVLNEAEVRAWVEKLAGDYDTAGKMLEFQTTRGDVVEVKYDTYGTKLDQEAEVAYLMEALSDPGRKAENHIPAYLKEGYVRELNDIGGTYIEVDMTEQHMYYYVDGALELDTDIVTGNTGRRMGTPQGVNFVYNKQKNRTLRGPGYATPVKYWMPVRGNVGIHDASWRSSFGGEIYKTNGSHGCINTPADIMAALYEKTEIGTPVIMFY